MQLNSRAGWNRVPYSSTIFFFSPVIGDFYQREDNCVDLSAHSRKWSNFRGTEKASWKKISGTQELKGTGNQPDKDGGKSFLTKDVWGCAQEQVWGCENQSPGHVMNKKRIKFGWNIEGGMLIQDTAWNIVSFTEYLLIFYNNIDWKNIL